MAFLQSGRVSAGLSARTLIHRPQNGCLCVHVLPVINTIILLMTWYTPSFLGDFCPCFGRCVTSPFFRSQREELPVSHQERLCRRNINDLSPKVFDMMLTGLTVLAGDVEARVPGTRVRTSLLVREPASLAPTPEYPHTRIRRHPAARFAPVWLAVLGCCNLPC